MRKLDSRKRKPAIPKRRSSYQSTPSRLRFSIATALRASGARPATRIDINAVLKENAGLFDQITEWIGVEKDFGPITGSILLAELKPKIGPLVQQFADRGVSIKDLQLMLSQETSDMVEYGPERTPDNVRQPFRVPKAALAFVANVEERAEIYANLASASATSSSPSEKQLSTDSESTSQSREYEGLLKPEPVIPFMPMDEPVGRPERRRFDEDQEIPNAMRAISLLGHQLMKLDEIMHARALATGRQIQPGPYALDLGNPKVIRALAEVLKADIKQNPNWMKRCDTHHGGNFNSLLNESVQFIEFEMNTALWKARSELKDPDVFWLQEETVKLLEEYHGVAAAMVAYVRKQYPAGGDE